MGSGVIPQEPLSEVNVMLRLLLTVTLAVLFGTPAAADLPATPDAWTEFATAQEAADAGWWVQCGLSQQLIVATDCDCGEFSVGCRTTRTNWGDRFGLTRSVPVPGLQSVRFAHKTSWTGYDHVDWHCYLVMAPTPAEEAAGLDAKQVHWQYDKAEEWTVTTLALADGEWAWRDAESGMWLYDDPDGTTEPTTLVSLEWYTNILYGLTIGDHLLIDALTLVTESGVPAPEVVPDTPRLASPYPNPANPSVSLDFTLPQAGQVRLDLLDAAGRRVCRLLDAWCASGPHHRRWDGRDARGLPVASGVYLVRLQSADGQELRPVTIVR
jgi:hypothetical protein